MYTMKNLLKITTFIFLLFGAASCVDNSFEEIEVEPTEQVKEVKATSDAGDGSSIPPGEG